MAKKEEKSNGEYEGMEAKRVGQGPLDSLPRDILSEKDQQKYRFRKIKEMIDGKSNGGK